MWTICWTGAVNDDGETKDGWERWDDLDDVINHANTLVRELDVCEDSILIFPPAADELTIPYGEIENYNERNDAQ
jgi:hypothetical protein